MNDDNGTNSGSVYVYTRTSPTAQFGNEQKITAYDAASTDLFGRSTSLYENTLVVGAYGDDDGGVSGSGSVYVYTRTSPTAQFGNVQKITAGDPVRNAYFGLSTFLYKNTLVVGGTNSGAVYVYTRTSPTAQFGDEQKLTASDGAADDSFGRSTSLYENTLVVGAYRDDDNGTNSGSVYVYTRTSPTAQFGNEQKITAYDAAAEDNFGYSVFLYENTMVVGAYRDDDNALNSGSVYVYTRTSPTAQFGNVQKITASDGAANDKFGISTSLNENTLVVGASYQGAVYVNPTTGNITPKIVDALDSGKFITIFTETNDIYIRDVNDNYSMKLLTSYVDYSDISTHGTSLIMGLRDSGLVSIYDFTTNWSLAFDLQPLSIAISDEFGTSVSMYSNVYVVGAPGHNSGTGAVYAYVRKPMSEGGDIATQQILTDTSGQVGDNFGIDVDLYDTTLIVSSNYKNYIYKYDQVNMGFLLLDTYQIDGIRVLAHAIQDTSNSFITCAYSRIHLSIIKPTETSTTGTITTTTNFVQDDYSFT